MVDMIIVVGVVQLRKELNERRQHALCSDIIFCHCIGKKDEKKYESIMNPSKTFCASC